MAQTESSPLSFTSEAARAYLLNVAEVVYGLVLPEVEGKVAARVLECVRSLTRVAAHLVPPPEASAKLALHNKNTIDALHSEAAALELMEVAAAELLDSIYRQEKTATGRNFDQGRLEQVLRTHARGGSNLRVTRAQQLQGGRSKQTILVSVEGALDLPEDLVLRQDWASAVTGTSVISEFELLKHLFALGLRVPEPLLLEVSPEALGAPFIVVTRLRGSAEGDPFTPPKSEQPVLRLAEQIGRVHAQGSASFVGMPGIVQRGYTATELRADLGDYRSIIEKYDTPSETIRFVIGWLDANVDRATQGPLTLVHGDLGFHNFLCENDDLVAILDWEVAHIGSPARDLGYIRSMVTQATSWAKFMESYHAAGGPLISEFILDYYTLLSSIWLYQLLLQARAGLSAGLVRDMEITFVCAHFMPALLTRISRELTDVLTRQA